MALAMHRPSSMAHGTAIKALTEAGESPCHAAQWSLPVQQADGSWLPGEWLAVSGRVQYRGNGLHVCSPEQLGYWTRHLRGQQLRAWVVEYDGQTHRGLHGLAVRRARLLRPYAGGAL